VQWRTAEHGLPPSRTFLSSPYNSDAHDARKYTIAWVGYKVHLTETCEDDQPRLITHVETTAGPVADGAVTEPIHEALAARDVLPATHIVDTGYLDAELLVTSAARYRVDLLGPTRPDYRWQARADAGLDAAPFAIDWAQQRATCPAGHQSRCVASAGRPQWTGEPTRWSRSSAP
jgi:transposase